MCIIKVVDHFYSRKVENVMDLDRICLLQFLREVTGLDWICVGDVICTCVLPWNDHNKLIWCDYELHTTLDHWNDVAEIEKLKPLEFIIQIEDQQSHEEAIEQQKMEEYEADRVFLLTNGGEIHELNTPPASLKDAGLFGENHTAQPLPNHLQKGPSPY